jgi:hypothetical protein
VNCTTCHVSPNGGGVLTPYGKGISEELQSTWGKEGEGNLLHGAVKPPEWLHVGGNVRAIQVVRNTPSQWSGNFFFMQADLEAYATVKQFTFGGTLGYMGGPPSYFPLFSRRHFVMYQPSESFFFRAGRFQQAYGLNVAEHQLFIRKGLGWDQDTETYNLEGAYITDKWEAFLTANFGRFDMPLMNRETGFGVRGARAIGDHYKVGVNYAYLWNSLTNRHLMGFYGVLGFTANFYLLTEADFQYATTAGIGAWGFINYLKVDYEFFKGFHAFLLQELTNKDLKNLNKLGESYGIGIQFFPRPHFDLQLVYEKSRAMNNGNSDFFIDYAFLILHYYL